MSAPKAIYISGPITGKPDANKAAFAAAATALQARYPQARIVNPHDNGLGDEASWEAHMRADVKLLMDCDAICLLDGWSNSQGANIEYELSLGLGIEPHGLSWWLR